MILGELGGLRIGFSKIVCENVIYFHNRVNGSLAPHILTLAMMCLIATGSPPLPSVKP